MKIAFALLISLVLASPALARGFLGGLIEGACGNCGLGDALDGVHEDIGNPLDVPGRIVREANVELWGPALGEAIRHSRDDARRAGTKPIPNRIRNQLLNFFPASSLAGVEYRVGAGHELSVQSFSIRHGDASAVTLIDTIIFENATDAEFNDSLWSHEIRHVEQFQLWGLTDFGKRYVRSSRRVEEDAYATQNRYDELRPTFQQFRLSQAQPGSWIYIGQRGGTWNDKNFTWNGLSRLPQPGGILTATVDVNVRTDHIRFDNNTRSWRNAQAIGAIMRGESVRIDRVIDVTDGQGYYWARISN